MKKIILTLTLSLFLVGGGLFLPVEEGHARGERGERAERREDRRDVRRAYAAGAVGSHRRGERRERREDRRDERHERHERREDRRDVARAAVAVGAAAAIIDAAKGIETQTRKLFEVCRSRNLPVITFLNKLDRPGMEPLELLDQIEEQIAAEVRRLVEARLGAGEPTRLAGLDAPRGETSGGEPDSTVTRPAQPPAGRRGFWRKRVGPGSRSGTGTRQSPVASVHRRGSPAETRCW